VPRNCWHLKSCKQEPGEPLRDYIRWFSKQCISLLDVINIDVVSAFLSGTTCKSLVHKLGCRKPRTTRELLDIAMNHASGEEVVGAVFTDGRAKGKAKREYQDEGPSSRQRKRKKKDRHHANSNMVAAADRAGKRQGNTNHFEQLLEKPCPNHGYPVKLKDCELLKHMLDQPSKHKCGDRDKEAPKDQGAPPKDGSGFLNLDGCLMIFEGPEDDCSKRQHKVQLWEFYATGNAVPKFLRWSSTLITFDRGEHPPSVPRSWSYPLVVNPIIGNKCLTKVLMDGGSSLNILYVETLDAMGISRSKLRAFIFPFLGIIPGMRAYPLGNIDLPDVRGG
jgi:hypothetical protein